MHLPESIWTHIAEKTGHTDNIGMSGSCITVYDDCVLKIEDEYTQFLEIEDIYLEVGETYYLKDIFADYKGLIVVSHDNEITSYNSQTKMLNAYQEGETNIVLKYKGQNQLVKVVVGKIAP